MRQRQHHRPRPASSLSALLLLGASSLLITPASAVPYPKDDLHAAGFGYLQPRQCAQYCGYQNQYCCSSGSTCMTQAGIAVCADGAAGGGGGWAFYTTTWTETETFTSTFSSAWAPATTAVGGGGTGADCVPVAGSGQIACGSICCASDQYCAWKGQCYPNAQGGGSGAVTTTIVTGGQTITTQYSAPYRVTSGTTVTQTSSPAGTGTLVSQTSTSSSGNGTVTTGTASSLSPGAIAGIVIGVLAGVALLLLICACFLVRGLWHGLLALLGLGGNRRRRHTETVVEEERYSRHGHSRPASVHSRRDTHGGWFGGGGGRPSNVSSRKEKKKSSGVGWLGLGAAAGTLLLLLGLRRDRKKQNRPVKTRSDVSSSYFGSDSYTASSPSSAGTRRTRESRHSRGTRTTRHSRPPSVRH
ncbi:hypothetical protein CONLIGDRAFT_61641 [Coniochaeta ligniaria NRRL 30616]|uniref:Mid2 domain-containing protein n=1 Tax=Coniochaeta ligniaria NRRL 30616 TaxID=1408157 RepID=A0A1J7J5U3_9PEZI|nr:hypothetical protein CONLIGDRAFT_61641 [Coniochaeta ligniaria NRRL 30616]